MLNTDKRSEAGVSVLEILIVLVVAAILVTAVASQMGTSRNFLVRQNIAREFKTSLERARFDSVKRRPNMQANMSRLTIVSETSYIFASDLNQDGVIQSFEERTVDFSSQAGIRLVLPMGLTAPVSISFDHRGHAIVADFVGAATDHFFFCQGNVTPETASNANTTVVYISSTGTVAMSGASESRPTVTAPNISTVAAVTGINPDLTVWLGSLPSATPNPSPSAPASPTATPSATPVQLPTPLPTLPPAGTPTASPTATPTATPTAQPTATPLQACSLNERPGSPATCSCNSPWFVGKNGKCGP